GLPALRRGPDGKKGGGAAACRGRVEEGGAQPEAPRGDLGGEPGDHGGAKTFAVVEESRPAHARLVNEESLRRPRVPRQSVFGGRPGIAAEAAIVEQQRRQPCAASATARGARSERLPALPLATSTVTPRAAVPAAKNHAPSSSPSLVFRITSRPPGNTSLARPARAEPGK